jgi:hypothetical protein
LPPVSTNSAPLQSSLNTTLTEHDTKNKAIRVEARARVYVVIWANVSVSRIDMHIHALLS